MKASELITLLQDAIDKYGDLEVRYWSVDDMGREYSNEIFRIEEPLPPNLNDPEWFNGFLIQ